MIKQNYITDSFLFAPIKELSHSNEIILPEFDVLGDNVETRTNEDIQLGASCTSDVSCPKKAIITPTGSCSTFVNCVEDTNCPSNVFCPANLIPCSDFCVEDFDYVEGTLYYKYFDIFSYTSGQPITWLSDSNISDEWNEGVYVIRTDISTSAETTMVLNKCRELLFSQNRYLLTTRTRLKDKTYTMYVNCHLAFSGLSFSFSEYTVTASTEFEVRNKLLSKEMQLMANYDGSPLEEVVLTPINITIKTDESNITTGNKINRSQTINGTKLTVYNSNNINLTNNFIKGDTIIYNFGTSERPYVKNIIRFKCPFRYIIIKRSRPGYEFDDIVYTINTLYENSYIYINDENGYDITKIGNVTPTDKIATVNDFKTIYPNALYGFTFFIDKTVFENKNTCLNPSMSSDDKYYFDQYNELPYMTTELIRIQDLNGIKSSFRILSNFLGETVGSSLVVYSTLPNNISMSGTISGNNIQY